MGRNSPGKRAGGEIDPGPHAGRRTPTLSCGGAGIPSVATPHSMPGRSVRSTGRRFPQEVLQETRPGDAEARFSHRLGTTEETPLHPPGESPAPCPPRPGALARGARPPRGRWGPRRPARPAAAAAGGGRVSLHHPREALDRVARPPGRRPPPLTAAGAGGPYARSTPSANFMNRSAWSASCSRSASVELIPVYKTALFLSMTRLRC
jgi:hypothetical protein